MAETLDRHRRLLFQALVIAIATVGGIAVATGRYASAAFSLVVFLATGVGVLAAFYLDSVIVNRQKEDAHRRAQERLANLRATLLGAVLDQWKNAQHYWFTNVQGTVPDFAKALTDPGLTTVEWAANAEEFLSLCEEREQRSTFAHFFDRIARFADLARTREDLKMQALEHPSAHRLVASMKLRMEQAWTEVHEFGIRLARAYGDADMKKEMGVP